MNARIPTFLGLPNDCPPVLRAYLECAVWTATEEDGSPLDERDYLTIPAETYASMLADVSAFLAANAGDLLGLDDEQVGHDFWLTRNRHGAGFWDRGLGERGERLTKAAHPYGSSDIYADGDDRVWLMEG